MAMDPKNCEEEDLRPWDLPFLPSKPPGSNYGYFEAGRLIDCTREELIRKCQTSSWNGREVNLAWTPDTENVVPVERIPFLFEAIRERRKKQAQEQLVLSIGWGVMLFFGYRDSSILKLRHLLLFLVLIAVLPAIQAVRSWRGSNDLTPEALGRESKEHKFQLWCSLQKAPWTIGLVLLCAAVTLMELFAPLFGGSLERAALVRPAVRQGEIWRLLTCVFPHADLNHLFCNMMGLAVFGNLVEVGIGRQHLPLVFLCTALAGSLFSFLLNGAPSIGASGGVLGLAGFVFVNAGRSHVLRSPSIRSTVASVLCLTALGGVIAYDLFDSAAHLGGFLAGLGMAWAIQRPKEIARIKTFQLASTAACGVLVAGAVGAIVLTIRPVAGALPKHPESPASLSSLAFKTVSPSEVDSVTQSLGDADPNVSYVAAYRLSRLGEQALPALTRSLDNAMPRVRLWAACALGMIGPGASNSAPALAPLLQDPDPQIRMAVAYALGKIGWFDSVAGQAVVYGIAIDGTPVRKFWTTTRHKEVLGIRTCTMVAEHRWMQHSPRIKAETTEGIETVAGQPDGKGFLDITVKLAAERYVWEVLPQAEGVEPLLEALGDPTKGLEAAIALSRVGRRAVGPLVAALTDPEPAVRERAAVALGWIGPDAQEAIPHLIALLQNEPPEENGHCRPCGAAAYALASMGSEGKRALADLARSDDIKTAAYAVAQLDEGNHLPLLDGSK